MINTIKEEILNSKETVQNLIEKGAYGEAVKKMYSLSQEINESVVKYVFDDCEFCGDACACSICLSATGDNSCDCCSCGECCGPCCCGLGAIFFCCGEKHAENICDWFEKGFLWLTGGLFNICCCG